MNSSDELPPPRSFEVQDIVDEPGDGGRRVEQGPIDIDAASRVAYAANLAAHPSSDVG